MIISNHRTQLIITIVLFCQPFNMTAKLFLDTDATDTLIYKMNVAAEVFYDHAAHTYSYMASVPWEGPSKDAFLDELQLCTSAIKKLAENLELLKFQLAKEVDQWLFTASKFGG